MGRGLLVAAVALALAGCVSVRDRGGLVPPPALVSHVKATVGTPRGPIPCAELKSGRADGSVHVQEWVWTGISADVIDMALERARRQGGLRSICYADYEMTSYFGFVTVFSLTAYGE